MLNVSIPQIIAMKTTEVGGFLLQRGLLIVYNNSNCHFKPNANSITLLSKDPLF